jgi:hypothetical protein
MPIALLPILFWLGPALAAPTDCNGSKEVAAFLQANQAWKVLELTDLFREDQALWKRAHGDDCPGLVEVRMESDKVFTAVALVRRERKRLLEKIVLIPDDSAQPIELSPENPVAIPQVISRIPPGRYLDRATEQYRQLTSDGLLLEQIEAGAAILYLRDGAIQVIAYSI